MKRAAPTQDEITQIVEVTDDLDKEFREQGALYAWLGGNYAEALDRTRRLKNELAMLRAKLADKGRQEFKHERATKDLIEGWVIRRPEYQALQAKLFDAQLVEDTLSEGLRALEHKKSALENLAANLRREWEATTRDPVVRGASSFSGEKR